MLLLMVFLFGGIFIILYGTSQGFDMTDKFIFLAIFICLIITISLGYLKFIKSIEQKTKP